jgi:hypothetical protein
MAEVPHFFVSEGSAEVLPLFEIPALLTAG